MPNSDLSDLDAFAAVARARSFRSAAAVRGVSASTLSEALRRLEARLGVRLLHRTTRSVTPTEPGLRLLEQLEPALGAVANALDVLNGFRDTPCGTLRLNVPTIVARQVLPSIVPPFLAAHPGIVLEVIAQDAFVDVLAAGCDAGIRYDERLDQDMIAVPIGPRVQSYATAAAPAYLARRAPPDHPLDLTDHTCIRHRFSDGRLPPWEFERGGEIVRIDPPGVLISTALDLEIAAAEAGLGIITGFDDLLRPAFETGRLVPVLKPWWQRFPGPRLYFAGNRLMPAPLRAFVDFLAASRDR